MTNFIQSSQLPYLSIGDYVACMYDKDWYIGVIQEVCEEEGDIKVSFMHPKGPGRPENSFYWPSTEDVCYAPQNDVIGYISTPKPSSKRARKFKISSMDMKLITDFKCSKKLNCK